MALKIVFWGDSHIPYRAEKLPDEFLDFVSKNNFDVMVVTGDLVRANVLDAVKDSTKNLIVVRGNMDEGKAAKYPLIADFSYKSINFTVFHGHGIYPRGDPDQLWSIAKKRNAKIIITGHTHIPLITQHRKVWIINPGSVCGVYGGAGGYEWPTWGTLEINDNTVTVTIYEIRYAEVRVYEKRSFEV